MQKKSPLGELEGNPSLPIGFSGEQCQGSLDLVKGLLDCLQFHRHSPDQLRCFLPREQIVRFGSLAQGGTPDGLRVVLVIGAALLRIGSGGWGGLGGKGGGWGLRPAALSLRGLIRDGWFHF